MQGLNEWRNIQDIVRLTFKAFHDVLKAQGDAIKGLERAVDAKANRREVANALAAKADAAQLCERMQGLEALLTRKADATVRVSVRGVALPVAVTSQPVAFTGVDCALLLSLIHI